jgi:hypothetical protein
MKKIISVILLALCMHSVHAQTTPRKLPAQRLTGSLKIDGDISDEAWKAAPLASDFVLMRPNPGTHESEGNRTEVRILYDNYFVYVAGYCHEANKDSMTTELVGRDNLGANDFAGVIFDTYLDKINASGFFVTPLGEQFDTRYSSNGEDESWNAVWESESKRLADGWSFEMRIPYSALRFNKKEIQDWGLNFFRKRTRSGQDLTWNPVSPQVNGFVNQFGEWTGIQKIKAPVRLSFSPYFSTYVNHYPANNPDVKNTTGSINGGMDVKYGINESFTLDLTAIPDFGQVQSDNQVLNLTPFEVKFNENRTFFTEGTELFNKANSNGDDGGGAGLFYSRRIGGTPLHYYDVYGQLNNGERVIKNPGESKLLNAVKISGRNKKKLGIGVLNAITRPSKATIGDANGKERELETAPLTNYNMIVLDQALKNNSSISFLNTNVWRAGADYDANVMGTVLNFNNKANTYNFSGKFLNSRLMQQTGTLNGYQYSVNGGKGSGRFRFNVGQELTDHKFNQNDMGILFNNNYLDHYLWVSYRWLKPTTWFNRLQLNYNLYHSRRYNPGDYQSFGTNINGNVQFKNISFFGFWTQYRAEENDFYEPRVAGWVYKRPRNVAANLWFESNGAKKYSYNIYIFSRFFNGYGGRVLGGGLSHRYRVNDKLSFSHGYSLEGNSGMPGFAGFHNNDPQKILFGNRYRTTIENVLNIKYNFNNKMGITMRTRHYWSRVENKSYYQLQQNGLLTDFNGVTNNYDRNFNFFNVDMVYTWQFALGSFINIVWKNNIFANDQDVEAPYFKNLGRTLDSPQNNSLSLRVIYFLDYLNLRKKRA